MRAQEFTESSPMEGRYYHDVLAAQLPAGLTDDNDIVGKAFVIAGYKLGMVKASRLFRYTPGFEQDLIAAYHRLHGELKETAVEDDLSTAQEIGAQLQSAMEDLYYAHRMSNPNPTVKQNINMLQQSIRSLNQELNSMGYKYAPTVPGLVARKGARFVEDELSESKLWTDVPNEDWLQGKIDYAQRNPRNSFGVPVMGSTTAGIVGNDGRGYEGWVELPVSLLKRIPGARGEQRNVRYDDLKAIMKIMKDTGKLPLMKNGKDEYLPFILVGYDGQPWVFEGNHRIMAAAALGWPTLKVVVKYFDGGERVKDGMLYPPKIGLA